MILDHTTHSKIHTCNGDDTEISTLVNQKTKCLADYNHIKVYMPARGHQYTRNTHSGKE